MILGAHLAYWTQTLLRVVGVLIAVLLPAGELETLRGWGRSWASAGRPAACARPKASCA